MNRYNHPKHKHLPPNVRGILSNQSDDKRTFIELKENSNTKKKVRTLLHQNLLECLREHRRESTKFMAYPDAYNKEHQIQNFISFSISIA